MCSTALLFVSVLAIAASLIITKDYDKQKDNLEDTSSCQHFTQGLTFNDSQALGTWYLLHLKRDTKMDPGDLRCVEFSLATNEERKNLSNLVGEYVGNLKWENLTLKMDFPCGIADKGVHFLEKFKSDGSYRTLQVPTPTDNLHQNGFNRLIVRLKIVEGQYLGMMACYQNSVFLLSKQPPQGTELDSRLKKIIESYWPEKR